MYSFIFIETNFDFLFIGQYPNDEPKRVDKYLKIITSSARQCLPVVAAEKNLMTQQKRGPDKLEMRQNQKHRKLAQSK